LAKHNRQSNNLLKSALSAAFTAEEEKVTDQRIGRATSEEVILKKKITKLDKKISQVSGHEVPKALSLSKGTAFFKVQFDFKDDSFSNQPDLTDLDIDAINSGTVKVIPSGRLRDGDDAVITVKEATRQGLLKASQRARNKRAKIVQTRDVTEKQLDKAKSSGLSFARKLKSVVHDDDPFKKLANENLAKEHRRAIDKAQNDFAIKVDNLLAQERSNRKAFRDQERISRVKAIRRNKDNRKARKLQNRINRAEEAAQKRSISHLPLIAADDDEKNVTQSDDSELPNPFEEAYFEEPRRQTFQEAVAQQPLVKKLNSVLSSASTSVREATLDRPSFDIVGDEVEQKGFPPPDPNLDFESCYTNPYQIDDERENTDPKKRFRKSTWRHFCIDCFKCHQGDCLPGSKRRIPAPKGSWRAYAEEKATVALSLGNSVMDDSNDNDHVRLVKNSITIIQDVFDAIYLTTRADEVCVRIGVRNFVERYIDSKDYKYSRVIGIVMYFALKLRNAFRREHNQLLDIQERLTAFCVKYKKDYRLVDFKETVQTQSFAEDLLGMIRNVRGSEILGNIYDLVSTLFSVRLFKDVLPEALRAHVKPREKFTSYMHVIEVALTSVSSIEKYFHSWLKGTPLSQLVFSKNPLLDLQGNIKKLYLQQDHLFTGLPVPGHRCIKEYANELKDVIKTIPEFLKNSSPWRDSAQTLKLDLEKLKIISGQVESRILGECRMTPFAVLFASPPGTGKSNVLRVTAAVFSEVRGRDFDDTLIYPRSRTSQYWEGYNPLSHPYVFYSEMGTTHVNIAKSVVDERLIEMTSVIDNLLMYCDMAFEGKGKTACSPEAVFMDTNTEDMNLSLKSIMAALTSDDG